MEKIIRTAEILWGFRIVAVIVLIISVVLLLMFISGIMEIGFKNDEERRVVIGTARTTLFVAIISLLAVVFIPSKKTYIRMHAAKDIQALQENTYWRRELPEEEVQVMDEWIHKYGTK